MTVTPINGVILERFEDGDNGYVSATLFGTGGYSYYAEIDLDRFDDADQPMCVPGAMITISAGSELKVRRNSGYDPKGGMEAAPKTVSAPPYGDAS